MRKIRWTTGTLMVASILIAGFAVAGTTEPADVSGTDAKLAEHYLAIQTALADDATDGIDEHARALASIVSADGKTDAQNKEIRNLEIAADDLAVARDLKQARVAFGKLSEALVHMDRRLTAPGVQMAYCPMADKHWLQEGDKIANPYYGSQMLRCGAFVKQPKHEQH